jgi:hypothetical protein
VQPPPSAADLLAVVAEVLTDEIVPQLSGPAQHHARVAASIVGIVERELRLRDESAEREARSLRDLLTDVGLEHADLEAGQSALGELRRRLAAALRAGLADDPSTETAVWAALVAAVRDDLAIVKPGHDDWAGD